MQIYLYVYAVWVVVVYKSRNQGPELKSGASLEATSTAEREWLYVTPHSHSPTHYRDDSLFVFPIRENTATAILPRARGPSLCIFFSLRTCCSTFHIWQCTEALLYEKWYFHGRHKNCICIADADDLDFPRFSGYSDILWFWS